MLKSCILSFLILALSTSNSAGLTIDIPDTVFRGQTVPVSYTHTLDDPSDFFIGTQGIPSFEVQSGGQTAWQEQYPVSDQFPTGTFTLEAFPSSNELVGSGATILGVSNEFTVLDSGSTPATTIIGSVIVPGTSTGSVTTPPTSPVPSSSPTPSSSSSKIPAIIGGVVGGLVVLAIFTFFAVRHRLSRQHEDNNPQLRSVQRLSRWHISPFGSTASSSGASNSNRFREKRPVLQEQRDEVSRLREQLEQVASNSDIGSSEESPRVLELRQRIQELTELLAPPPGYEPRTEKGD